jgi:hypothetical protein
MSGVAARRMRASRRHGRLSGLEQFHVGRLGRVGRGLEDKLLDIDKKVSLRRMFWTRLNIFKYLGLINGYVLPCGRRRRRPSGSVVVLLGTIFSESMGKLYPSKLTSIALTQIFKNFRPNSYIVSHLCEMIKPIFRCLYPVR